MIVIRMPVIAWKKLIQKIKDWLHPQPPPSNDGHRRHHRRIKRKREREAS